MIHKIFRQTGRTVGLSYCPTMITVSRRAGKMITFRQPARGAGRGHPLPVAPCQRRGSGGSAAGWPQDARTDDGSRSRCNPPHLRGRRLYGAHRASYGGWVARLVYVVTACYARPSHTASRRRRARHDRSHHPCSAAPGQGPRASPASCPRLHPAPRSRQADLPYACLTPDRTAACLSGTLARGDMVRLSPIADKATLTSDKEETTGRHRPHCRHRRPFRNTS